TTTTGMPTALPGTDGVAFELPGEGGDDDKAFTYDEVAVPVGSTVTVESAEEGGRTTVTLEASGLAPTRDFGVHVHTQPCGPQPSDAGPHYQNDVDPAATPQSPSTDPAFANPGNEVWLDITTDGNGNAQASTTVDWEFRDDEANSVVLHAERTKTGPGEAGMAGARLACVDEDF
ncbi:MAG: superoxide dismutase family protein, partial [Rhodococcus sp. (in: high G+C Gram-positive bacteria)]|nr:superoxide dismutase family protein [Rhodococcus sp. (in: high G+C Gram-positive bacteria)]MDX5452646.1 superoxide dismutase family protein [Rhodococcus sp. (in: high G+C Gram-positive bacteria)]